MTIDVAKIVTAFTISHSITLSLAALKIFTLPSSLVEALIAASIIFVAVENYFSRDVDNRWRNTFLFGFIHGFGFASALTEMGVPQGGVIPALAAFNIGVELGQVAIVLPLMPVLFAIDKMAEGPFPEHYEPFETPVGVNLMCPGNAKAVSNPAARVYKGDMEQFGTAKEFPFAATTYRLTEHFHYWTKNAKVNSVTQPSQFVEIGEDLAKEKGIKNGDMVKVKSNRGEIKAACVVTKRIKALNCNGKKVHTVGIPIHWGFIGETQNGYLSNTLTPYVGDANSQTPEFKAFLVNIAKA